MAFNFIESEKVELKEKYTDNIVRDIVAFLNATGGDIYIGVSDDGILKGLPTESTDEIQMKISDCITNQIEPSPRNEINTSLYHKNDKVFIQISINKGFKPIYYIKKYGLSSKGCLIRIGTTCKEMTNDEINNRYNTNFLDDDFLLKAPSRSSQLSFDMLMVLLTNRNYTINKLTFNESFNLLRSDNSYNLMAEILADKNTIQLIFAKFNGKTKTALSQRNDYGGVSILLAMQAIKQRLISENICVTNMDVHPRVDEYLYDFDCVYEAFINAMVHNDWTLSEPLISFYTDRLEITSHGGLPKGMSVTGFFKGVSHPRNHELMRIFVSLGIVEHTGHGIPKILEKYGKEAFDIQKSYINVIIPFNKKVTDTFPHYGIFDNDENIKTINHNQLSENETRVILELVKNPYVSYNSLGAQLNVSRRTLSRIFASLVEKEKITRIGTNKKGYWKVNDIN